jgi:undecaprenyl diphosphate synthase
MTDDVSTHDTNIHLAIVPDGNRRWARKKKRPEWYGHLAGAKKFRDLADWCYAHPEIKTVSIYALSTENLARHERELSKLWEIYRNELKRILESPRVAECGLRINVVGDTSAWRADVRQVARDLMAATKNYTRGVLNILIAYGSQFEIVRAARRIVRRGARCVPFVPKLFNKFLLVSQPVDLLIRTGGEHRLSNFLLWQAAYAEIYFSATLWPDFSRREFERILRWYKTRDRRLGR